MVFSASKRLIIITSALYFGAKITTVIYRMTTIVSDPTITQTESLANCKNVCRRQEAPVNLNRTIHLPGVYYH